MSTKKHNKNMHSDKIKLRSFLTTLYFAGDVGVGRHEEGSMAINTSRLKQA